MAQFVFLSNYFGAFLRVKVVKRTSIGFVGNGREFCVEIGVCAEMVAAGLAGVGLEKAVCLGLCGGSFAGGVLQNGGRFDLLELHRLRQHHILNLSAFKCRKLRGL